MSLSRHPTDTAGHPLPDGSWPDPAGSAGSLDVVRRFCNSTNREHGADAWRSAAELSTWLWREHAVVGHVTDVDLVRLRAIRDATWTAIVSHALDPLVDAIRGMSFALAVDAGRLTLAAERPADIVVARLVDSVLAAQADRSWGRLKACARCDWVFYDRSKNRSGRWCTMDACGSRHKARAYRHRRSINDHLT